MTSLSWLGRDLARCDSGAAALIRGRRSRAAPGRSTPTSLGRSPHSCARPRPGTTRLREFLANEHRANRGGPPVSTSVSGWDAVGVQGTGDLGEPAATRIFETDPLDHFLGEHRRPAGGMIGWAAAGGLAVDAQEAIELVDGDKTLTPGQLDRVDGWDDMAVDRGDTHAERFGRLPARVGEPFDLPGLSQLRRWNGLEPRCAITLVVRPRPSRSSNVRLLERSLRE